MTTAFIPSPDRYVPRGSVIRIDGAAHPIVDGEDSGGYIASRCIVETLRGLGWQPATDYYTDLRRVADGYELDIRPTDTETEE